MFAFNPAEMAVYSLNNNVSILFFKKNCSGMLHVTKKVYICSGEVAEWSIATVLKTVVPRGTGGSNPSFSAQSLSNIIQATEFPRTEGTVRTCPSTNTINQ